MHEGFEVEICAGGGSILVSLHLGSVGADACVCVVAALQKEKSSSQSPEPEGTGIGPAHATSRQ